MLEQNELTIEGTIAHYQLQRLLARGGMSHVYLALDTEEQHIVAIKLVHSDEGDYCTRFQREVNAISNLHHDHILPAFDYGEENSWCYMVMPYIEGGTLKHRLAQGSLPQKEVEKLFTQLTEAVQFAHEHGILHRDLKPSNILVRDGEHIYLTDFGLVQHVEEESNITGTGYTIGTPEYMAPELFEHAASIRSDVYALGIILYEMLTGRVPFKGSSPIGTCWKHIHEQAISPSTLNPAISASTEAVILRALAKDPQDRFKSAHELACAFQDSLRQDSLKAESLSSAHTLTLPLATTASRLPKQRIYLVHPGLIAVAALLLLFILPGTLGFLLSRSYGYDQYNQTPTLLGASGSFVKGHISGKPPTHLTPQVQTTPGKTSTPAGALNHYSSFPVSPTRTSGSSNGGSSHEGDNGNHKHTKHGKGDNGGGDNGNGGDNNNSLQSTAVLS